MEGIWRREGVRERWKVDRDGKEGVRERWKVDREGKG